MPRTAILLAALVAAGLAAPALAQTAPAKHAPAASPATPVRPLTVKPEAQPRGKVVASTEAAPLTSPDFTAKDAADPPVATIIAPNTAVGRTNIPIGQPEGLLKANPDLNRNGKAIDLGVTTVF